MYFVCCKILGVEPGADQETIKAAYRKAAKELHPDVNPSEKAQEYFIILKNAYQYLLTHPYTEREVDLILKNSKIKKEPDLTFRPDNLKPKIRYRFHSSTLHEVLRHSVTAQVLYLFFHGLFITAGLYLIVRSVYDVICVPLKQGVSPFSAYFSIAFAIVFGILLSLIFLYSGYCFFRQR